MASKLGAHLMAGGNPQGWIDAGARVFKFAPEVLGASSQVPPGALVIGKLDQFDPALGLTDWKAMLHQGFAPEAAADVRFNAQRNIYAGPNKPPVDRYLVNGRVDVWEDDNEIQVDNATEAAWYCDYCIEMMKLYDSIGKKRANFSFAVGTPELWMWNHLIPAVRYARDNGHYIALHEYMGYEADYGVGWRQVDGNRQPTTDVWHGRPDKSYPWGWAILRYRYVWDTVLTPAGLGDTRLLITELGCDSVPSVTPAGMSIGTWKEHAAHWTAAGKDPEETYAGMLQWYDDRIREDAYVAGAVIFTVGSVGIWANWDIEGTDVASIIRLHIEDTADDPDPAPTPPVEPPTEPTEPSMNMLSNGSFEGDWLDAAEFPGHIPAGWAVNYRTGDDYPNPYGQPYKNGEAVKKHRGMLPPHEQDVFVFDGEWTYKIFGGGTKAFWFEMEQVVNFAPGAYRLTVPVWVDHYHWSGGKDFDVDPDQAQIAVWVGGTLVREWTSLKAGQRHDVATSFVHPGGAAVLRVGLRSNWDINGNFWLDGLSLSPLVVAPPPPPPPGKHKAIVVKLPQDMTAEEWGAVAEYAFPFRHTMTASHDDMLTILKGGNAESYVKLAYPARQTDVAALIEAAGYTWEPILVTPTDPFAGLVFGQPLDTPWAKTSAFDAPRDYSSFGGKKDDRHEGLDVAPTMTGISRVLAVADGVVTAVKSSAGYGNYVIVRSVHNGTVYDTWRAHMASAAVTVGQTVKRGDVLGVCGSTGNSTGRHDHLTMTSAAGMSGYIVPGVVDPTRFYPTPGQLPPPAATIDLLQFKIADPDCWRVVQMTRPDGTQHSEDVQDMLLTGGLWVRRKGNNGEWHRYDENFFYLVHDTSPDVGTEGIARVYTLYKDGQPGAPKSRRHQAIGVEWIESGTHQVRFRARGDCRDLAENSGAAQNRSVITKRVYNYTFNGYGQNLTFDEVLFEQTGVETQIYGRINGKSAGWIGWSAPWGFSEPVAVYWNRGRLAQEPERHCSW